MTDPPEKRPTWFECDKSDFELTISGSLRLKWDCPICGRGQDQTIKIEPRFCHLVEVECTSCKSSSMLAVSVEMNSNSHLLHLKELKFYDD